MAILANNVKTLADWAKQLGPDGKLLAFVELLKQRNGILDDMNWMEGNLPTGHRIAMRTGLPQVAWRLLNAGIQPSKSTSAQVDEQAGMMEAWSEVDKDLALLNGNTQAFRLSEAQAFIEAMNQKMATTLFYGNSALDPEQFTGLSVRYSDKSALNGKNIVDAGGVGTDNTSIWLVCWGDQTLSGIFPKGSKAGLVHEDLGEETAETTAGIGGSRMRVYRDRFQWKAGIALKDWRYVVRIANIDVSNLVANSGTQADLSTFLTKAMHRIQDLNMGRPVFYMNRTAVQQLDIQRRDDVVAGGGLTYADVDGKVVMSYRGVPIRVTDAIIENEARVL